MSEFKVNHLLTTETAVIRDILCCGTCHHRSPEECASVTQFVFPYRGLYVRHIGREQAVADANHVLFFNAEQAYQISHPIHGGDASLVLVLPEPLLDELMPHSLLEQRRTLGFSRQHQRIDPRAQALVALLRHNLENRTPSLEPSNILYARDQGEIP